LTASGGTAPYNYLWAPSVSVNNSASGLGSGIYTVIVTDINGCSEEISEQLQSVNAPTITIIQVTNVSCAGTFDGSITASVMGGVMPYSIQWSNGATTQLIQNLSVGIYTVTVTDQAGCTASGQASVTEPDPILVITPANQTICQGGSANIGISVTGGIPPYLYSWSNGSTSSSIVITPSVNSTYEVTVTDDHGCTSQSNTITVTVLPPLELIIEAPDTVCSGMEILITVLPQGGDGNYAINWSNGMTGTFNNIVVTNNTTISFVLSDGCGSPDLIASINIATIDPPSISFDIDTGEGCEPLMVHFTLLGGAIAGYQYVWDFGDGNSSFSPEPSHLYNTGGMFNATVTVTASGIVGNCSNSFTLAQPITVHPKPEAMFVYDPPAPTMNLPTVHFQDISTGAISWNWNFGDGSQGSDMQSPIHTYSDTGTYIVTLYIISVDGCEDSIKSVITVRDDIQIFIPNAFTPDGSGSNDYFTVYGVGITSFEMSILDRWGKLIYKFNESSAGWDGTDLISGKIVHQGLYVYTVSIVDHFGLHHTRFGKVTLLR